MPPRIRRIAFAIGVLGLLIAIGCAATLYVAGLVIDEHHIDPKFRLIPLFAGIAIGALAAGAGFGTWVVGYVPATKNPHAN